MQIFKGASEFAFYTTIKSTSSRPRKDNVFKVAKNKKKMNRKKEM